MAKKKTQVKPLRSELVRGDCTTLLLPTLGNNKVNLVVADPPYNLDQAYDSYNDSQSLRTYLTMTERWVDQVKQVMHPHGSFFVFMHDSLVSEVDVLIKRAGFHKRSQIVWYYTFGTNTSGNFTPSHTQILYYTKSRTKYTWNGADAALRVPSARQLLYNDKRAHPDGRIPDNTWILHPSQLNVKDFSAHSNTWEQPRIAGTFHERREHSPNQLPIPIVERIVRFTSKLGDLVVDPFLGSGTTGVVCRRTGRHFVGMDLSKTCVRKARERIDEDGQQP